MIEPSGAVSVFLRVLDQAGSELTGPAFSPDGTRLYLSSQRGGAGSGITYEITGPFRTSSPPPPTTTAPTTSTTAPVSISLTATKRTSRNRTFVDLRWTGATASTVEVRRNGTVVTTTANDGAHTDSLGKKKGTFRYEVSHPGGSPVSNEATIVV